MLGFPHRQGHLLLLPAVEENLQLISSRISMGRQQSTTLYKDDMCLKTITTGINFDFLSLL
jgi:hypothetical protein